jgi:hypothetical protein
VLWTIAVGLALVWLSAGSYKILNAHTYKLAAPRLAPSWLPARVAEIGVLALPGLEAVIGFCLVFRQLRRPAGIASAALVLVLSILTFERYRDGALLLTGCGCNWPFLTWLAPNSLAGLMLRNVRVR